MNKWDDDVHLVGLREVFEAVGLTKESSAGETDLRKNRNTHKRVAC